MYCQSNIEAIINALSTANAIILYGAESMMLYDKTQFLADTFDIPSSEVLDCLDYDGTEESLSIEIKEYSQSMDDRLLEAASSIREIIRRKFGKNEEDIRNTIKTMMPACSEQLNYAINNVSKDFDTDAFPIAIKIAIIEYALFNEKEKLESVLESLNLNIAKI